MIPQASGNAWKANVSSKLRQVVQAQKMPFFRGLPPEQEARGSSPVGRTNGIPRWPYSNKPALVEPGIGAVGGAEYPLGACFA